SILVKVLLFETHLALFLSYSFHFSFYLTSSILITLYYNRKKKALFPSIISIFWILSNTYFLSKKPILFSCLLAISLRWLYKNIIRCFYIFHNKITPLFK